jgi:hypothetical protein
MFTKNGCPHARVNGAGARVDNDGISGQLNRNDSRLNLAARLGTFAAVLRPLAEGGEL